MQFYKVDSVKAMIHFIRDKWITSSVNDEEPNVNALEELEFKEEIE